MLFTHLLQWLKRGSARDPAGRRRAQKRPGKRASERLRFVPQLTMLEDRTLLSTFTVLNAADSGSGSLRQAILSANSVAHPGLDTIVFAPSVHKITLTSGELKITEDLNIVGPGANKLSVSGNDASRIFDVQSGSTSISGLTVTHGRAGKDAAVMPGAGGGILNQAGASLTLSQVVVANNQAVGDPSVVLPTNLVFNLAGGATGGGVANFGTLTVDSSTFTGNQALGADHTDSTAFSFPGPAFAGNALGGSLSNFAVASVADCQFIGNLARAGSDCKGDFAAIGGGGAILNDAVLTITGSSFSHNQAIAGNNSISPFHNGHALGGAVMSGSLLPAAGGPSATLVVSQSSFDHNQAIGGNDNTVTLPLTFVPPSEGPNNGYGGAILVYQGSATISQSTLTHNQAIGGAGGAAQNGSLGVGGGIFFFSFVGGVTASVSDCTVAHNEAIGGAGRNGGLGGAGLGGGIAIGSLGSPFGASGTATISNTIVDHNLAQGGQGGLGGDGGDGLGGGIFNDADSTLDVTAGTITHNQAKSGKGKGGGSDGQGIGGGVYNLGTFTSDVLTVIKKNHADTSNDDLFP